MKVANVFIYHSWAVRVAVVGLDLDRFTGIRGQIIELYFTNRFGFFPFLILTYIITKRDRFVPVLKLSDSDSAVQDRREVQLVVVVVVVHKYADPTCPLSSVRLPRGAVGMIKKEKSVECRYELVLMLITTCRMS